MPLRAIILALSLATRILSAASLSAVVKDATGSPMAGATVVDPWERTVTLADKHLDLNVSLKLSTLTTTVQVSGRRIAKK
jgi:hypothetical protein